MQIKFLLDGEVIVLDSMDTPMSVRFSEDEKADVAGALGHPDAPVYDRMPLGMSYNEFDSIMNRNEW
jgi:hypothetical protein